MGFCLFNNIAVGVEHTLNTLGDLKECGIFDFDVHHGNGTEAIFYERADVHFTSIHEAPWYVSTGLATDTGSGAGVGTTVLPLAAGADDASLLNLWLEQVRPAWETFEPEIIFSRQDLMVIGGTPWPISTIHQMDLNVSPLTLFSGLKLPVT